LQTDARFNTFSLAASQLKGHLEFLLPKQPRKGQVRGAHKAMPYAELPAFIVELRLRRADGCGR
jgi:hypothetical protein